ncbi:MAG: ABC transporter permease [Williamsia sp.]|nr:ABC transporter permease [Williamsia sp.]
MLTNYFRVAWRNLLRNKVFSIINITGLAVGMAAVMLIGLWVQNEYSYDQFHVNKNSLYKVYNRSTNEGVVYTWDVTSGPLGKALQKDFSEVKNTARIYWSTERLFNYGDKSIKAAGNDVDKPFLSMFSFHLLKGNTAHALDDVNSLVLTEDLAEKLFGKEEAIGKMVMVDGKGNYKVTGVLQNLPSNTEFSFSYLTSLEANENTYGNNWNNNTYYTYVQLQQGVSPEAFNKKIEKEIIRYVPGTNTDVFLYPVAKQHLYSRFENGKPSGGRIDTVRLLLIIAGLILLIACINFMNLSTAQSGKRALEVGVRKVMGAGKAKLIAQFLCESVLMAAVAALLSLLLVWLSLPAFNQLVGQSLTLQILRPGLWLSLGVFILLTGLLAGSYPAFFLSAFKPVTVLKGANRTPGGTLNPRKALVVLQFSVALVLTISTLVVYRQIRFVQKRDAGYGVNNLAEIPIEGSIRQNYDVIKAELLNKGVVTAMCRNSLGITIDGAFSSGYSWTGSTKEDENTSFSRVGTDADFVKTTGVTLLAGRDIDINRYPYDTASVVVNEAAVAAMRLKKPVGTMINMNGTMRTVVGVIKNFIIGSPYEAVKPMVVIGTNYWTYNIVMRFGHQYSTAANLRQAEGVFKKYNPAYPFTLSFVDDEYGQKFSSETQTATMAALFAGLTIFISCLGLFGLATYMAENRSKEIGIRKVLGATVGGIVAMLSREFVGLVLIAILIATPAGWYLMHRWLEGYTYRTEIGWSVFVFAGLSAIGIAVFSVSLQAIRAAIANPVKSLRTE